MTVAVRRLEADDWPAWLRFVADIPKGEERFFKDDLTDRSDFERWVQSPCRSVAVEDGAVAGSISALPGRGWSAHVAELRLVVGGSFRGRGLGRTLAHRGLTTALELGCTHVFVEVVAEQEGLISMFRSLGFRPEAILEDFVRDGAGVGHDLMLLTHHAAENWSALAGLGMAETDT